MEPLRVTVGMQNGAAAVKNRSEVPEKLIELPYNPSIPMASRDSKETRGPDRCGSVSWESPGKPKGCPFDCRAHA